MQKKIINVMKNGEKNCNKYNVTYVNKEHQATEMTKGFYGVRVFVVKVSHIK